MRQAVRLHETTVGRQLLSRFPDRPGSRYTVALHTLRRKLRYLETMSLLTSAPTPRWKIRDPIYDECMTDVRRTPAAPVISRTTTQDKIETSYNNDMNILNDLSVMGFVFEVRLLLQSQH